MHDLATAIVNSREKDLRRRREGMLRELGIYDEVMSLLRDINAYHAFCMKLEEMSAEVRTSLDFLEKRADSVIGFLEVKIDTLVDESRGRISEAIEKARRIKKGDKGDSVAGPQGPKPIAGVDYPIPHDGVTPSTGTLLKLIEPLIPPPVKGDDGRTPVKGIDYFDGKDSSPDTPEQIGNKINMLEEYIEQSAIKGLRDYLKKLQSSIRENRRFGGGVGGGGITELVATGAVNGVNAIFTFTQKPTYIVLDGVQYRENKGWTLSGLTATMSSPPTLDIYGISK